MLNALQNARWNRALGLQTAVKHLRRLPFGECANVYAPPPPLEDVDPTRCHRLHGSHGPRRPVLVVLPMNWPWGSKPSLKIISTLPLCTYVQISISNYAYSYILCFTHICLCICVCTHVSILANVLILLASMSSCYCVCSWKRIWVHKEQSVQNMIGIFRTQKLSASLWYTQKLWSVHVLVVQEMPRPAQFGYFSPSQPLQAWVKVANGASKSCRISEGTETSKDTPHCTKLHFKFWPFQLSLSVLVLPGSGLHMHHFRNLQAIVVMTKHQQRTQNQSSSQSAVGKILSSDE